MTTEFQPMKEVSSFRRLAAGMWKAPNDPTIYGSMDLDATSALAQIEEHRRLTGEKLTMTHLVSRAVARAFARHPELNARVRFWGKLEQRKSVDLFVSVSTDGGKDLSGARIDGADQLSLSGWIEAVKGRAEKIRAGRDQSFEKSRGLFRALPWWAARPVLWLIDFLSNELSVHLPGLGMPRDPFGTAVITNVGMFGIDTAFAPFVPMARCPMLLLLSEVRDRPWVEDGKLTVRPVLRLCATFDHRLIDGASAGILARELRGALEPASLGAAGQRAA
jgi:pyruvate dehydrogenase E2 component (dihydrolipoamide acetyltransferase)